MSKALEDCLNELDNELYRAVAEQTDAKTVLEFEDKTNAINGVDGFIYNAETVRFYTDNQAMIVDAVEQFCDDIGEDPIKYIRASRLVGDEFKPREIGRVLYGNMSYDEIFSGDLYVIANFLAWFAVEDVANNIIAWAYEHNIQSDADEQQYGETLNF